VSLVFLWGVESPQFSFVPVFFFLQWMLSICAQEINYSINFSKEVQMGLGCGGGGSEK
jgi:hypothetical protein